MPMQHHEEHRRTLRSWGLDHDAPHLFAVSQWCHHASCSPSLRVVFVVYRWVLVAVLMACCVASALLDLVLAKWFAYLTSWGLMLLLAQALLAALLATAHYTQPRVHHMGLHWLQPSKSMTVVHKTYWILNNLANALAPVITVGYWAFIYNPKVHTFGVANVCEHVMNVLVVVVDFCLAAHPVRMRHFFHAVLLILGYGLFTLVYFEVGGTNNRGGPLLYPQLDWLHPWMAVLVVFLCALVLATSHLLFCLLCAGRTALARVLAKRVNAEHPTHVIANLARPVDHELEIC